MGLKVGSARIDERGKISGGQAGDSTGKEVMQQNYYMHKKGWYCFRPKDIDTANRIAQSMIDACNNNNIGYDQNQRDGVINLVKKGTKIKNIKTKTECDCSALVRACLYENGIDTGNIRTATMPTLLPKTGKFEDRISVNSNTTLYNGDILVTKTSGHTVIVTSGNPRKKASTSSKYINNERVKSWQTVMNKVYKCGLALDSNFGPDCEKKANKYQLYKKKLVALRIRNDYVKWLQNRLKELGYKISVDGSFWNDTDKIVRQFQKDKGLKVDGYVGANTVRKLLK